MIWSPPVLSENLPLLHVNGASISLSVIYQQSSMLLVEPSGVGQLYIK